MSPWAIETERLSKRFGRRSAVDDLSLRVPAGSVFGLLGNNGAGKTSTIRMLVGNLAPTAGGVRLLGTDLAHQDENTRRRIAYLSDRMQLPGWMTVAGAIAMNRRLFPNWDAPLCERLLDRFRLPPSGRFRRFSLGERRKTLLLITLAQGADLFILDEPTLGLDVVSRHVFLDCLLEIALGGRTVLLSSHLLSDVERVVDHIAVLRDGRLILHGGLEDLKERIRRLRFPSAVPRDVLGAHFTLLNYGQPQPGETVATVTDFSDEKLSRLGDALVSANELRTQRFNLEDLFVELMTSEPDLVDAAC